MSVPKEPDTEHWICTGKVLEKLSSSHTRQRHTYPHKKKKRRIAIENKNLDDVVKVGKEINVGEVFAEGEFLDAIGTSKGKGFQGVVKRYNFKGVNDATHGQHNRMRAPGSIGASSYPSRVFKGMRMGGRTGGSRVKLINLQVLKVVPEKNLILVKGAVPGPNGSYVIVERWS